MQNIYFISVGVLAVALFMYGFFPLQNLDPNIATEDEIPTLVEDITLNSTLLMTPSVERLVLMVIDAWRWDFLHPTQMPYTSSLVQSGRASAVIARADAPTVTMPRIKALTTGASPQFIDIIMNLGSKAVNSDNIIAQAKRKGRRIVFYGDETWFSLYPNAFENRSEGTTSFFVSDFTEVDTNVTRNLGPELIGTNAGWDWLILHFLGLDHIGHVDGPESPYVPIKLQEMDAVIQQIHTRLVRDTATPLIVVLGDHGMHEAGGHGGSTLAERLVPLVTIGDIGRSNFQPSATPATPATPRLADSGAIPQIDLVPTLSILLGQPIPALSKGKLIPSWLGHLPIDVQLHAHLYNAARLASMIEEDISHVGIRQFLNATQLHAEWLRNNGSKYQGYLIIDLYNYAQDLLSSSLTSQSAAIDLPLMLISTLLLIQISLALLLSVDSLPSTSISLNRYSLIIIIIIVLMLGGLKTAICASIVSETLLCQNTIISLILQLSLYLLVAFNSQFIHLRSSKLMSFSLPERRRSRLLILGMVVHACSLSSSSLVEEEHQTWYFLWTTLGALLAWELAAGGRRRDAPLLARWLILLILHRVLRRLNQTGDKWASLPDLGDYLARPECRPLLSIVLFIGLAGTCLSGIYLRNRHGAGGRRSRHAHAILCVTAVNCIFLNKAGQGLVALPLPYPLTSGLWEARAAWLTFLLLCINGLIEAIVIRRRRGLGALAHVFSALTSASCLAVALLSRPHNVLLVPALVVSSVALYRTHRSDPNRAAGGRGVTWLALGHLCLGKVIHYEQGHGHSIASIDIAAGYVGLDSYSGPLVGAQLLLYTFSGQILSLLLLLVQLATHAPEGGKTLFFDRIRTSLHTYSLVRISTLALYVSYVLLHREHLFIWSVFAPKLLFEAAETTITAALIAFARLIICLI